MITVYDLMDLAEAYAIEAKLNPSEDSLWRSLERKYSKAFSTPLHQVADLDPTYVLNALYENSLEEYKLKDDEDLNEVIEILNRLQDPNYDAANEAEELEYNKQALKEEEERLAKRVARKAKKHAELTKPAIDPIKGGVNLAYLSESEATEG